MTSKQKEIRNLESQAWARHLLRGEAWAVLDVETTGLGPQAQPVEIAVVDSQGDLVFQSLIRPDGEVEPAAARLHGLDAGALASAPTFPEVYPEIRRALKDRTAIAYWAVFDRTILERACHKAGLPAAVERWECAYERYAAWRGFAVPLGTACEIEGIPVSGRHRAEADARLVWELVVRMGGSGSVSGHRIL